VKHLQLKTLLYITILATSLHALPVGDPRTPETSESSADIKVEQGTHEISLHAFLGASKINYPDMSGTQFSPGFGAGFSYSYFFTPRWSFLLGGGLALFNNRGTDVNGYFTSSVDDANDYDDGGSDRVIVFGEFRGYVETQWSMMVTIPLMFQYQSNESRNKAFYYAIGAKIGIPFAGSYKGTVENAALCGYYPGPWGEPPTGFNYNACQNNGFGVGYEDIGFGNYGAVSSYEKLKFSTAAFAAVEAGVKWRLYNKLAVYTGFWMDWAVNDVAIAQVTNQPFTWKSNPCYEGDPNTPCGSVTFRSRTEGRAIPVSMGFALRFSFGAGSHYEVADSIRWIREVIYRDSLLDGALARIDQLTAEKNSCEDSLAMLKHRTEALIAADSDREAMLRRFDSLEVERRAEMERARLAMLEKARLDSIENYKRLEASRSARLAEYRVRLNLIANGLDDYNVTQTVPSSRAQEKLDTAAVLLQDYPDLRIRITGHTCDKGTNDGNIRIGAQRAQSAKNYLVNTKGIRQNRIEIATKADSEPVVPNTSEENRRKNRRVQIEIIDGTDKIEQEAK